MMGIESIEVGKELGRFDSMAAWVRHAKRVYMAAYQEIGGKDVITLDSANPRRVVIRGKQFMQAEEDNTYPVCIYALKEV